MLKTALGRVFFWLIRFRNAYGLLLWVARCRFIFPCWENSLAQLGHLKGFCPLWLSMCLFTQPKVRKRFGHSEHRYGRSPVWERTCTVRCPLVEKPLPQWVQVCGTSPVWDRVWSSSSPEDRNDLPHTVHRWFLSPRCICMCLTKPLLLKAFPQTVHMLLGPSCSCWCCLSE